MSQPARQLPAQREPRRSPTPSRVAPPARTPATRPTLSTPPRVRARRGSHPAFWLFSAILVAGLVLGVVALNALVVNTTYRLEAVEQRQRAAAESGASLEVQVAHQSSPSRISRWASAHGMVLPDSDAVVPLQVAGPRVGDAG